uniref:Uncharacterized protein n=1 Tax=Anser cygnoides TaxID=8845 RepID=A0A8B9EDD7_ANSCY
RGLPLPAAPARGDGRHFARRRGRGGFPRVLRLLEAVGRAAPGAVRFRHGARLRLGLQAAVSTPAPFPAPPAPCEMADALPVPRHKMADALPIAP